MNSSKTLIINTFENDQNIDHVANPFYDWWNQVSKLCDPKKFCYTIIVVMIIMLSSLYTIKNSKNKLFATPQPMCAQTLTLQSTLVGKKKVFPWKFGFDQNLVINKYIFCYTIIIVMIIMLAPLPQLKKQSFVIR